MDEGKRTLKWGLLLFLAALVVRLAALWAFFPKGGWSEVGYGSELGQIAANLAAGRGFSSPFADGLQPTAWVAPLIPLLWALVFTIGGVFSLKSLVALGLLQCLASAGACCFYYLILRQLFRQVGRSQSLFFGAALALLLFWPLCLKASVTYWYFSWQECAVAGLFWAAMMWLDHRTWKWALALGLYAGLVALINPVPLVLFCGICVAVWRRDQGSGRMGGRWFASMPQLSLTLTVMFLMISPWLVRNAMVFHALIPSRSCFGIALWQGNNPEGAIVQAANSRHPAMNPEERSRYLEMGEHAYDQAARQSAIAYMRAHPGTTVKRTLQRIYVFWGSDIRGDWAWRPGQNTRPGIGGVVSKYAKAMLWVGPTLMLVWAVGTGRTRKVPQRELFLAIFLLFPLPYYATTVSPLYAYVVQPYMLIMVLVGVGASGIGRQPL